MFRSSSSGAQSLIPEEYQPRMRTFALRQSVYDIASGLQLTDGRVVVVHRSGRVDMFPDMDHLTRDYTGTCSVLWDREGRVHREAPRLFVFRRFVDSTGFSGPGVAMEGGMFADGQVVLTWLGPYRSLVMWPNLDQCVTVHGHGGDTVLAWLDEEERVA